MSFVPAFPWRLFVLAVGNRDRANKNEIAIIVLGVTTKDLSHDMLPPELSRVDVTFFLPLSHTTRRASLLLTGANQKTFSVCSRRVKRRRKAVYPHAEAFFIVIVANQSYKVLFLKRRGVC